MAPTIRIAETPATPAQLKKRLRVALICMPWCSITIPSLPLSILKCCAAAIGAEVHVHYLNIWFAEQIGFALYEQIAIKSALYPEWFFAVNLFGGDSANPFVSDLDNSPKASGRQEIMRQIVNNTCGSVADCVRVAGEASAFVANAAQRVDWKSYDIVGFTVTHAQVCSSLLMARTIKELNPRAIVVFGGASAQAEMGFELLRAFPWVDYIVHGEGERAFPAILCNVARGIQGAIPGVSMRHGETLDQGYTEGIPLTNLNDSPSPDHDDYFSEIRRVKLDRVLPISISIESSRGCWWGAKHLCTFCGLNGTGLTFRSKSADRLYEEIIGLSARYQWLSFIACDTILDMKYFRNLLPRLAEANLDLSFFYEVKPNLTRDQVEILAASGIARIQPGIEALNTALLQLMKKGSTTYQNIQFLKWCQEFGIDAFWNLLHGFPGEISDFYIDYPRIMRLIFHLQPPVDVCPITFERFSPYDLDRQRFGLDLRPLPFYDILFPANVRKDQIAYFFDASASTGAQMQAPDLSAVKETFGEWRELWQDRKVSFSYERGPNFLILHDNRPLKPGQPIELRRVVLNELAAKAYLFCEEAHSFESIAAAVLGRNSQNGAERDRLLGLLSSCVSQSLMYQEGDRFLSLAVANRRRPTRGASYVQQQARLESGG